MICQVLVECRFDDEIDSEVGSLMDDSLLATVEEKFAYVRHNKLFGADEIAATIRTCGGGRF
jgi:hypothetical protein